MSAERGGFAGRSSPRLALVAEDGTLVPWSPKQSATTGPGPGPSEPLFEDPAGGASLSRVYDSGFMTLAVLAMVAMAMAYLIQL